MAVRVKIRLKAGSREVVPSALVNTGFESPAPDVAVPTAVAKALGLWPPARARLVSADTGGGEVEMVYIEAGAELELEDRRLVVNVLVNPYIDEVLLSDYVAGELCIIILDAKRGLWRFCNEDAIRQSAEPQRWR